MSLSFLTLNEVLEIHSDQIQHYGGKAGIRDLTLLSSAIAQPSSTFEGIYLHKTIYDKAAAYLFHICQNHPFIDGNKRTSLVSMLVFLDINHYSIDYHAAALEQLTFSVAEGIVQKKEIAAFLST